MKKLLDHWIFKNENSDPLSNIDRFQIFNQQNKSSSEHPFIDGLLNKKNQSFQFDDILKKLSFNSPTPQTVQKPKADKSVAIEILEMHGLPMNKGGWWVKSPIRAA